MPEHQAPRDEGDAQSRKREPCWLPTVLRKEQDDECGDCAEANAAEGQSNSGHPDGIRYARERSAFTGNRRKRSQKCAGRIEVQWRCLWWRDLRQCESPPKQKRLAPHAVSRTTFADQFSSGNMTVIAGCGSSMSSGPQAAMSLTSFGLRLSLRT